MGWILFVNTCTIWFVTLRAEAYSEPSQTPEAALLKCSYEKVFWKYAACKATLPNHALAWVSSSKFAAYFQKTFS